MIDPRPGVGAIARPSLPALLLLTSWSASADEPWATDVTGTFQRSEVVGDFDGDGERDDRVIGLPRYRDGEGMVAILFNQGLDRLQVPKGGSYAELEAFFTESHVMWITTDGPWFTGSIVASEATGWMGDDLAVGDFDGDGLDDLAIGLPGADLPGRADVGVVAVLYGEDIIARRSTAGTRAKATLVTQDFRGSADAASAGDRFGEVLAAGDLNCDGYDDLAVGLPGEDIGRAVDAGGVHLFAGSSTGLDIDDNVFFTQGGDLSDAAETGDHFGAALTIAQLTNAHYTDVRLCPTLAIGVPGEDLPGTRGGSMVDAGAVHLLYPATYAAGGVFSGFEWVGSAGEGILHQATAGVLSFPETNDQFGASLGRVAQDDGYDSLWVGVPGENGWGPWGGAVATFEGTATGLGGDQSLEASQVRPDLLDVEVGRFVELSDDVGRWIQYVPDSIDPATAEILVVVHGTNADWGVGSYVEGDALTPGMGNAGKYARFPGWQDAAEALNLVIVVPQWEDWSFGNFVGGRGYRNLDGRDMRADDWVMRIVNRYAQAGLGDDTFYLFGHSAGGQFVNRFVTMNPTALDGAVVESPQYYTNTGDPTWGYDYLRNWPNGFGERTYAEDAGLGWPSRTFSPDLALFDATVGSFRLEVVVGALEDDVHTGGAIDWVEGIAYHHGVDVDACLVPGVKHSGKALYLYSLVALFPELLDVGPIYFADYDDCL